MRLLRTPTPVLAGIFFLLMTAAQRVHGKAPQPGQVATVQVNVLAYSIVGNGNVMGSCKPVVINVGGGAPGKVRVGFYESEVSGTGDMWRSAGWMAAVTSALLTDFDSRAMRVSYEYEGSIDGPSAGGLMTVGILAALRGDSLRLDGAMTGTINPDGTIGPVGGIVHKIEGAAAAGMKLVVIPGGMRTDVDLRTGQSVDLIELGRKKGIEVRPAFHVYAAYEALTGTPLPRPPAAELPEVDRQVLVQVKAKIDQWHSLYATSLESYTKLPGEAKLTDEIVGLYQLGVDTIKQADKLVRDGELVAALSDKMKAAAYGHIALEMGRCRQTYAQRGFAGMVNRLRDNGWLQREIDNMAARMRTEPPQTLDQLSVYLGACDSFMEAVSLQILAKNILAKLTGDESELAIERAALAAVYQIVAWIDLRLAGDYLDLAKSYEGIAVPADAPWRETYDFLRRASSANLAVFDSLIIDARAREEGVSSDSYRQSLMQRDIYFASLHSANQQVFPRLNNYFGGGDTAGYAYLGASMFVHTRAAGLIAKYYSLDAELDLYGTVTGIGRERTLVDWLAFAEDQSRRNIAALNAMGIKGTVSIQLHRTARIEAGRDLSEKVEGLLQFWSSDLHANVLRRIALGRRPDEG